MENNGFQFSSLDFLRSSIPVSYKKNYSYKTSFGAVLTLFIIFVVITYSVIKIKILIQKTSFTIISNESQNSNGIIDFSNIPILMTIYDDKGNNYEDDPKLYDFSVEQIEQIYDKAKNGSQKSEKKYKQLELERCDRLINNFELLNYFSDYNLTQYTCIKPGQNLTAYGVLGDTFNNYEGFRVYINKCNKTERECYEDNIIENKLKKNLLFIVLYLGYDTDFLISDKNKNINYKIYSNFITVSPYLVKKSYLNFILGKFFLYDNIFYDHFQYQKYFINGERFEDMNFESEEKEEKNTIAYFSFSYQGYSVEHTKKVGKIIDTISLIGTLFNIMFTIVKIMNNYFSRKILFIDIYEHFFTRPPETKVKQNIIKCNDSENILNYNKDQFFINSPSPNNDNISNFFSVNKRNRKKTNNISVKSLFPTNEGNKKGYKKVIKTKSDLLKYYLCPLSIIKKYDHNLININNHICQFFSLEKLGETIRKCQELSFSKYDELINKSDNMRFIAHHNIIPREGVIEQI